MRGAKGSQESKPSLDDYNSFLSGCRLLNIWIDSNSGAVFDRELAAKPDSEKVFKYGEDAQIEKASANRASLTVSFFAVIHVQEREVAFFAVKYRLEYETPRKMTKAVFDVFKSETLRLHAFPFARVRILQESVQMGIEPVVIPLVFMPRANPNMSRRPPKKKKKNP